MKTDSIFYQLFKNFPELFFELIGQSSSSVVSYTFESLEIKETIKRIDGVFFPTNNTAQPIYFVEVQFQPDPEFYYRLFTEIFLYIGQNRPQKKWRAVAVFARRSIDRELPIEYQGVLTVPQLQKIYLNELGDSAEHSLKLGMVQLVVEDEETAQSKARQLIQKVQQQLSDEVSRRRMLELIETVLVYKFGNLSSQEIEAMFGLSDLKQTRVFQEGKQEGKQEAKLETVPLLLRLGLSVEQIAQELKVDIEAVRKVAQG